MAPGQKPERVDSFLAKQIKFATRTKVQKAIENGDVTINGERIKPGRKIRGGDKIFCRFWKAPPIKLAPQDIPLDVVYEDSAVMVVNKPAGMPTHPGYGNREGTLVNAVLYYRGMREEIDVADEDEDRDEGEIFASEAVRPGIAHRLDKNTSGLLVLAKEDKFLPILMKQFEKKTARREYFALVWGAFESETGTFEGDIGRSPRDRKKFAVVKKNGKHALTEYEVIERFSFLTLVKVRLQTGRTHQIRVHFSHAGRPVFGDPEYGGDNSKIVKHIPKYRHLADRCLKIMTRQALHAKTLSFKHPKSGDYVTCDSELPEDFAEVLKILRKFEAENPISGD